MSTNDGTGNANVQTAGNQTAGNQAAQQQPVLRSSTKGPHFEGAFELYRAELERSLDERDAWRVATEVEQRPTQLRNVGSEHAISDDEMARLLLMGVAVTHQDLVEQFDLPTRQGNPPTLQHVTNALRSRDERDKMVIGSPDSGVAMSMNSGGDGRGAGGGRGGRGSGGRGGGRKWLPMCYHCKKKGPLKRGCYHYKNEQAKVKAESKNTEVKPAESKEKKKSKVIEHMKFLHNGDNDNSDSEDDDLVGMVQSARISRNASEWMLDTGTTTHVCTSCDRFVSQKKSKATFKVWDGQVTSGVMSGEVVI
ncbi:unnamed protein product [Phytophthora fragariaefolia]|uniref:Unnamed protein product n=1 Tax=Phytophthora fragariaefolia TaxID=1490495 RepID=A0A9W7D3X5_9STRA|nr:unnamed protein product [Phytophthora fragariaefolia]